MSILENLKTLAIDLRKNRSPIAGSIQMVVSTAKAKAKERGLKTGDHAVLEEDAVYAINNSIKKVKDTLSYVPNDSKSLEELNVLESLLPKKVSDSELREFIVEYLSDKEKNMKMMGIVMKEVDSKFGISYDKAVASKITKEVINN